MSVDSDGAAQLEKCARAVLAESVMRVDAATRSRLNQARQAALATSRRPQRSFWRAPLLIPFTGAVAAAVVAAIFLVHGPQSQLSASQPSPEVIDLLTSEESMSLMENYDHGFYEWAAAQAEAPSGDAEPIKPTS